MEIKNEFICPDCGRKHSAGIKECYSGKNALNNLPEVVKRFGKPYIMADANTYGAAGRQVEAVLTAAGLEYDIFVSPKRNLKPDEETLGSFLMCLKPDCGCIIAIGSGVLNDTGKIIGYASGKPYIIVATAPSMDGYASGSSSYEQDGIKKTLYNRCPDVVIGDTDILKNAPMRMIISGLGDMLAKYVSICEWRISNIITGEYYCETVAKTVREAVKKCVDNADGILKRDERAVEAVFDGLVLGGIAMNYASVSRPASGVEHYLSHIWDMRSLAFGTPVDFHGIQCAVGTLSAARVYDMLRGIKIDRERALQYVEHFDRSAWNDRLRALFGDSAEEMIAQATADGRYDIEKHKKRLDGICAHWDEIQKIISEEMPTAREIEALLDKIGAPKTPAELQHNENIGEIFCATKDLREKYMAARLCWDIGLLDEAADLLIKTADT